MSEATENQTNRSPSRRTRATRVAHAQQPRPRRLRPAQPVVGLPEEVGRHRYLNLDFETLGEEWGGPQFADAIVDQLVAE